MDNHQIKVLCVEDEKEIRENIVDILQDEGFQVVQAHNGNVGFEVFNKERPDIVVSDIMMNESSGYDLLKKIRDIKSDLKNTPIILLTALGQKDEVIKGAQSSANDYLIKPVDFDILIAKIKEKVFNSRKVKELHLKTVDNIKEQASSVLPQELSHYSNLILKYSQFLKKEPYGPFPHRKYCEDLNSIYMNSVKLNALVNNFISGEAVSGKINIDEEVIESTNMIEEVLSSLNDKFRNHIRFDIEDVDSNKIRINKNIILKGIKKIFSNIFAIDSNAMIEVRMILDHLNQFVFIFYVDQIENIEDFSSKIDQNIISQILQKQECDFKIKTRSDEFNALIFVPSHRVIL